MKMVEDDGDVVWLRERDDQVRERESEMEG